MDVTDQREQTLEGGTKSCHFSILLIEKDKALVKMLQQFLRIHGYKVDWTTDIKQIKQAAQRNRYDLVLLDIDFNERVGLQLIPLLQHFQPDAPLVTMTGHNPKEIEQQVRAFRVLYHFIKPFPLLELSQIIERIVTRNKTDHSVLPPIKKATYAT